MIGTHKEVTLADRRRRVAELYLRGKYQSEIASELGVSQPTISRDLYYLQREWLKSALVDVSERKAAELKRIDQLEREYWDAWKKSQEDAVTLVEEKNMSGRDKKSAVMTKKEQEKRIGQVGDPAYLRGVQWCIHKRCELLGLDAPKQGKVDLSTGGKPIDLTLLSDDQLKRLEDIIRAATNTRSDKG